MVYFTKPLKGKLVCDNRETEVMFIVIQEKGGIPEEAPPNVKINPSDEERKAIGFVIVDDVNVETAKQFFDRWLKVMMELGKNNLSPQKIGELLSDALDIVSSVLSNNVSEEEVSKVFTLFLTVFPEEKLKTCTFMSKSGKRKAVCVKNDKNEVKVCLVPFNKSTEELISRYLR